MISNLNLNLIKLSQRSGLVVCVLTASFACFMLGYSIFQWRADWMLTHQKIVANPILALPHETAETDLSFLPNAHLFGQSLAKIGEVPITNLKLQVTGIVKIPGDQTDAFSKAYLSISGQTSKIYRVGDSLPYGVKVYAITPDTVILENDNHLEKLSIPREKLQFKSRNVKELQDD